VEAERKFVGVSSFSSIVAKSVSLFNWVFSLTGACTYMIWFRTAGLQDTLISLLSSGLFSFFSPFLFVLKRVKKKEIQQIYCNEEER
jgi:hypothetical protein